MVDKDELILEMIKQNKSAIEISKEINLSLKQLSIRMYELKKYGLLYKNNYNTDGIISYQLLNSICPEENKITIQNTTSSGKVRFIATADYHLGHKRDCIFALNLLYEYAKQNDIHSIFHCGDFVEGVSPCNRASRKHNTVKEQIDYAISNHPFDPTLITYMVLGNHDLMSTCFYNLDIRLQLQKRRPDLVPIGYGTAIIEIDQHNILLAHPLGQKIILTGNFDLALYGHSHKLKIDLMHSKIKVPSLSNIMMNQNKLYPMALDITVFYDEEKMTECICKTLMFNPNVNIIGEVRFPLQKTEEKEWFIRR